MKEYLNLELERKHSLNMCVKKEEGQQYYPCTHHDIEEVTKSKKINRLGMEISISHSFTAPKGISVRV